jgi:hypothetical protein
MATNLTVLFFFFLKKGSSSMQRMLEGHQLTSAPQMALAEPVQNGPTTSAATDRSGPDQDDTNTSVFVRQRLQPFF